MINIDRNIPPTENEIQDFITQISFNLPEGFIDFFKESNGAYITTENAYVALWPITEMLQLNEGYRVSEFVPEFFLIGSNGGGEAYAIEKETGYIFEIPFIVMTKEDAILKSKTFTEFIKLSTQAL